MKEIKIEVKNYQKKYEAIDGTRFETKEDCLNYENCFIGVLWKRIEHIIINSGSEWDIFKVGCDDNMAFIVEPKTKEDIESISMMYQHYNRNNEYTEMTEIGNKYVLRLSYCKDWFDIIPINDILKNLCVELNNK